MKYKPGIDGLRAIAVIPVILFHAGFKRFSGGFVGVDVFLVISGFLITSIILNELAAGQFSILRFYERRARRILPALFLVLATCLPFACGWLWPSDMQKFSISLATVATFSSNFFFWSESGYFDTAAELKPLLHTWSLALEEQFYIFFPLGLMFAWRFWKQHLPAILTAGALISLALAQWGTPHFPSASFFLLPARSWELLIGSLVAYYFFVRQTPAPQTSTANELLGAAGLLLILYSVVAFDKNTPFPSIYTLIPTVGAALVILFANPATLTGKLLGSKALVGIGTISYSAYLWHQPLFAFARHRSLQEPAALDFLVLIALTLVLAYFSWRFVEKPFRQNIGITRRTVFWFSAAGTSVFIAFGLAGALTEGYLFRAGFKEKTSTLEYRTRINYGLRDMGFTCQDTGSTALNCQTSDEPEILLWGDSYADHLAQGLLASKPGLKMVQRTKPGCAPVLGLAPIVKEDPIEWTRGCIAHNEQVLAYARNSKTLKFAVLSSPFRDVNSSSLLLHTGEVVKGKTALPAYLKETFRQLKALGITPVIFAPPPRSGSDIGRCLLRAALFVDDAGKCNFAKQDADHHHQTVVDLMKAIEKEIKVIWISDAICKSDICHAAIADKFIYRDAGHLSYEGSAHLGEVMDFYGRVTSK